MSEENEATKAYRSLSDAAQEMHENRHQYLDIYFRIHSHIKSLGDAVRPYMHTCKESGLEEKAIAFLNELLWNLWQWTIIPQALGEQEYIERLCETFQITPEQLQEAIAKGEQQEQEKRNHELANLPYKEYLQTPEWKERRLHILERDSYRCQVCNSSDRLNVHHRDYSRRGYEDDSDLTTLCQGCHQVFHENSRLVRVEA